MNERSYDKALRDIKDALIRLERKAARMRVAASIGVVDSGGFFGSPGTLTLEQVLALIGAATAPTGFLRTTLGGLGEVNAMGTLGATPVLDLSLGNLHTGTLDQDATLTTTGWTNGKYAEILVALFQDGTGGWDATFAGTTSLDGGVAATTASTVAFYVLFSWDGGTTIYRGLLGGMSAGALADLSDVTLTSPALDDDLRFNGSVWVNDPRKWESVTDGEDVWVWVGDDLVHEWNS